MIQVNLLPDVKATYVKAQRTKRSVIVVSTLISGVSIGVVVLLAFVAFGTQNYQLSAVQGDIDKSVASIQEIEDLDKILTVQNQLSNINQLHSDKPETTRLFGYVQQTIPKDVQIDTYSIDFLENVILIEGNSKKIQLINKYVDTLKFTKFTTADNTNETNAFDEVVLSEFAKDEEEYTYSISLKFSPELFSSSNETIKLVIPNKITTRSDTEQPSVFKPNSNSLQEIE